MRVARIEIHLHTDENGFGGDVDGGEMNEILSGGTRGATVNIAMSNYWRTKAFFDFFPRVMLPIEATRAQVTAPEAVFFCGDEISAKASKRR